MRVKSAAYAAAILAGSLVPCAAFAATLAVATADLNIRSGPGPEYPATGIIYTNGQATVRACIEGSQWCQVTYRGRTGWVFTRYLQSTGRVVVERRAVVPQPEPVVTEAAPYFGVPTIEYRSSASVGVAPLGVTVGIGRAPAGRIVVEPDAIAPSAAVGSYVVSHPLNPVYLNSEVAIGSSLPETVVAQPVPDSDYDYVYLNDRPALIEPGTRRIVYVYR